MIQIETNFKTLDNILKLIECCHQIAILEDTQRERGFNKVRHDTLKLKREQLDFLVNECRDAATDIRHKILKCQES